MLESLGILEVRDFSLEIVSEGSYVIIAAMNPNITLNGYVMHESIEPYLWNEAS